jgi:hypothetical protein
MVLRNFEGLLQQPTGRADERAFLWTLYVLEKWARTTSATF